MVVDVRNKIMADMPRANVMALQNVHDVIR
jgi:hypothetical protein